MSDDAATRAPSSEEVSLALRRCWQPVARVEDLEHGPQRAVLLGEALAVFLTESGKPAVVADRCAHRGASLSMGKVGGESDPVPLPRLGVGRRRRRLHPDPLAARPEPDPAAGPDPGLPGAGAVGPRLDGAGGAARRAARPCRGSTPRSGRGATARRSSCRSASG